MENLIPTDPLGLPQIATLANSARVRITRADASDIVFDLLGAEPAITDPLTPETVLAPCRGVIGGTFADFAGVVAHLESELAKPAPAPPLRQSARVVLDRLTDAEFLALTTSTVPQVKRALETARIEGVILDADPAFATFRAGLDALGIIATTRWPVLLAP